VCGAGQRRKDLVCGAVRGAGQRRKDLVCGAVRGAGQGEELVREGQIWSGKVLVVEGRMVGEGAGC
jgi:hypothetical protein